MRNPRSFAATAAIVVVTSLYLSANTLHASAAAGPVPNSIQQVFHAGTPTTPVGTPIDGYAGELLSLQSSDVGMTAAEPTLGVGPDGTGYFAASLMVAETNQAWGGAETHTLRSDDGGLTWKDVQLKVPVANKSILPANLDPFVWVDQQTGRVFNIDLYGACSWLNFSDDKGETWTPNPEACGAVVDDHQTIGAGRPVGTYTPTGYPTILYYCVNRVLDTACGRSLNGGIVWLPVASPFPATNDGSGCGRLTGHIATDPDGRVFLPNGSCKNPYVAISETAGDSWRRVKVADLGSDISDTSIASDAAGNLYYVWMAATGVAKLHLPYLAISRDHGSTWSKPLMIAPPGVQNVNFPVMEAGDEGRIAINFPGTTYASEGSKKAAWNQYIVISVNALEADPVFLSATGNDPANPVHRGTCLGRCGGMWDFLDIVVSPLQPDGSGGEAWAAASDDCQDTCDTGTLKAAHDGQGIVIRQIGGPKLRG